MQTFEMATGCWMTDAHGVSRMFEEGDPIELSGEQWEQIKRTGQVRKKGAAAKPGKAPRAAKPAD